MGHTIQSVTQAVVESGHESFQEGRVYFYECDAYDKATHKCTAHDRRPNVCSQYPSYGRPDELRFEWIPYSPTCGYIVEGTPSLRQMMIELALELEGAK